MRLTHAGICLAVFLVVHPSAIAQKTWVVDAGGHGDFTTVQAAFDKALPRDIIFVESGSYVGATCKKGVRLLGRSSPQIQSLTVRDLPAGSEFTAKGVIVTGQFTLSQNKGRVHLESVEQRPLPLPPYGRGLIIDTCALVSIARCRFGPASFAITIASSTVYLTETTAYGSPATTFVSAQAATPALTCAAGQVVVAGGTFNGGSGSYDFQRGPTAPAPAIQLASGGDLTVAGDATTRVIAGSTPQYNTLSAPAIRTLSGRLRIGKDVTLQGTRAGGVGGSVTPTFLVIPTLGGQGAGPGGKVTVDAFGPAGSTSMLYVGVPSGPTPFLFGDIWLDLRIFVLVGSNKIPSTRHLVSSFPVPMSVRRGTTVAFQALNVDGQTARLSTPVTLVLH